MGLFGCFGQIENIKRQFLIMHRMGKFLDIFLEQRMDSSDGEELKAVLENTIAEEKKCLEQFELQIKICRGKIAEIDERIARNGQTHTLMQMKRAFEEQEFIVNTAAQCQQCSFETKGLQKLLYFEKNESGKERIAVDAFVMMYEWCDDLLQLTAKKFQDIACKLLSPAELANTRIARKKLKDFYDREKPFLSDTRHNAGAHREHDFLKQREIIENLNWSETIEKLHGFEVVTMDLAKSIDPLMRAALRRLDGIFRHSGG